ncbi:MAG: phosphoribosylformylglycinamidine synthase subunit PurL, partial [Bacteroidetes bacterium]
AVCLAESVIFSGALGADVALPALDGLRLDAVLFGEAQSRVVMTVAPGQVAAVQAALAGQPVAATPIGTVGAAGLRLRVGDTPVIDLAAVALREPYERAIPAAMGH